MTDNQLLIIPKNAPPLPKTRGIKINGEWINYDITHCWLYHTRLGEPSFYVVRYETPDGKEVVPLTLWDCEGKLKWRFKGIPDSRPLFNLHHIINKPDAKILIVEGEKKSESMQVLLCNNNKVVPTNWIGGTNGIYKTDWEPLRGRTVILWADNDQQTKDGQLLPLDKQPGQLCMLRIAAILLKLDCKIKLVKFPYIIPNDRPDGWDVADWINDGADIRTILSFISENLMDPPENLPEPQEQRKNTSTETCLPISNLSSNFEPLGKDENNFYYYKLSNNKIFKLHADNHTRPYLLSLASFEYWKQLYNLNFKIAASTIFDYINRNRLSYQAEVLELQPIVFDEYDIPLTDGAVVRTVLEKYPNTIKYDFDQREFYVWNNKYWKYDQSAPSRMIKSLQTDAMGLLERVVDEDQRDLANKLIANLNTQSKIEASVRYLQTEKEVIVNGDMFDTDDYLFCCQNGTINLKTGELNKHSRTDMISKISPIAYDENAKCPKFEKFMMETMCGDVERVKYLQRWFGYCLTGNTGERTVLFWFGRTTNGKGVLTRLMEYIFGDYGTKVATDVLMKRESYRVPNDLAALAGRRLITASESEPGQKLQESLIKDLVGGGDRIQARKLFKEFFTFEPKCKFILSTNFPPRATAADAALWRRIRVVKFENDVPPEKVNPRLTDELKAEASGILAWMVRGCVEWFEDGLKTPESIEAATKEYQHEMDVIAHWIEENCIIGEIYESAVDDLYDDYEKWSRKNGHKPMSKNSLSRDLNFKGFETIRHTGGKRFRKGLQLGNPSGF